MENWIWHQKIGYNKAVYVSSYFNISNNVKKRSIFESSFNGDGPFDRNKINKVKKVKIGFK